VFAESVQKLDDAGGLTLGCPGLQVDPVAVLRFEDAVLAV
jgi:hypothetical protein